MKKTVIKIFVGVISFTVLTFCINAVETSSIKSIFPVSTVESSYSTPAEANGFVKKVKILQTQMKYPLVRVEETIDPSTNNIVLRSMMSADTIIVKLKKGENALKVFSSRNDLTVVDTIPNTQFCVVKVAVPNINSAGNNALHTAVKKVSALPDVLYAEPNYIQTLYSSLNPENSTKSNGSKKGFYVPNDPILAEGNKKWGLYNVNAPEAWQVTTGKNVIIGVIDTGVDYTHEDLAANIWTNPNEVLDGKDDDGDGYIDDIRGWSFAYDNNDPMDLNSHGTHVAGIISATANNVKGVAGLAYNTKIMPLKASKGNIGYVYTFAVIKAISYAAQKNVPVINCSFGSENKSQAEYDMMENASNTLFVCAAGNDCTNNDKIPHYPTNFSLTLNNVISVANLESSKELSSDSCYGEKSVDLAAPGSSIISTYPGNEYRTKNGTSMAAPFVVATAALIKSVYSSATPEQIKEIIMKNVDKTPALDGKCVTGGYLNAGKALNSLIPSPEEFAAWKKGEDHEVKWDKAIFSDNVKIELLKDKSDCMAIADTAPNTGSFEWSIPNAVNDGSDYQIEISSLDTNKNKIKSCFFSIGTSFCDFTVKPVFMGYEQEGRVGDTLPENTIKAPIGVPFHVAFVNSMLFNTPSALLTWEVKSGSADIASPSSFSTEVTPSEDCTIYANQTMLPRQGKEI